MNSFYKIAVAGALFAFSSSFATTGIAQTQTDASHISWSQLTKQLEDQGYIIRDIDKKHNGWKVEVYDRNHGKLELRINHQGKVISQKYDD